MKRIMMVGGAEQKDGDAVVLRRFVELAGGEDARVVVMTTAALESDRAARDYQRIFRRLGARSVEHLDSKDRACSLSQGEQQLLQHADGVFFTGGDQLRITALLGGSLWEEELRQALWRGAIIAGTSAGASVMSSTMIVGGSNSETASQQTVRMAPGLDFLEGSVVDQHFAQRGRINRLLSVVAQHPSILGLGIDEDTAAIAHGDALLEVVGSSTVTIVDGRHLAWSNISEAALDEPLALAEIRLHLLPHGYGFDLKLRKPLLPEELAKKEEIA